MLFFLIILLNKISLILSVQIWIFLSLILLRLLMIASIVIRAWRLDSLMFVSNMKIQSWRTRISVPTSTRVLTHKLIKRVMGVIFCRVDHKIQKWSFLIMDVDMNLANVNFHRPQVLVILSTHTFKPFTEVMLWKRNVVNLDWFLVFWIKVPTWLRFLHLTSLFIIIINVVKFPFLLPSLFIDLIIIRMGQSQMLIKSFLVEILTSTRTSVCYPSLFDMAFNVRLEIIDWFLTLRFVWFHWLHHWLKSFFQLIFNWFQVY